MVSIKKRLVAILMTLVMALSLSVSAFAAEPVDVTQEPIATTSEEVSTRASLGNVIAGNFTTIYGGNGSLTVNLSSGNFWADIVAQIDYTDQGGIVTCGVLTPDGDVLDLGNISGSGSRTIPYELFYAPAGDYVFYFSAPISTPYKVSAFIYD